MSLKMDNFPLISVVVPVYNTAKWLRNCLDSLIAQTYQKLEIICVNDDSTDESARILEEYASKDERVVVINQKNAGVSATRNRGISHATGELLTFVDSDDWLELDTYEKGVKYMVPGVDLVCFGSFIDGETTLEEKNRREKYYRIRYIGRHCCGAKEIINTDAGTCDKIFRLDLVRKKQISYPEGYAYGEDYAFYVMYAAVARDTYFLNEKLYHYRVHPTSAIASARKGNIRCVDHLKILPHVFQFFEKGSVPVHRRELMRLIYECSYAFVREHVPDEHILNIEQLALSVGRYTKVLHAARTPELLQVRQRALPKWQSPFHWFTKNRECYGIMGRAFYSITHEKNRDVSRLLGIRIGEKEVVCYE